MVRRDRRRETAGALAASILVHIALFVVLAHQVAPGPRAPAPIEPDFQLQLVTQPPPAPAEAATPPRASRPAPRPASSARPREAAVPRPSPAPPARVAPARPYPQARPAPPSPPSNRTPNTPAPGAPAGQTTAGGGPAGGGRWTVQGGEAGEDGLRKFLRATVGCSHEDYVGLNDQERASCDRRVGRDARALGIPPDKIAGFIAAAEAQEQVRAGRTGPIPDVFVPCKGVGSNLDRGCFNMKSRRPEDGP